MKASGQLDLNFARYNCEQDSNARTKAYFVLHKKHTLLVIFYPLVQLLLQVFMAHHRVICLLAILQNWSVDESQTAFC